MYIDLCAYRSWCIFHRWHRKHRNIFIYIYIFHPQRTAHTAIHCNTLQHTAIRYNTPQQAVTMALKTHGKFKCFFVSMCVSGGGRGAYNGAVNG